MAENKGLQPDPMTAVSYVVVKRGLYYRPEAKGYTALRCEAGCFSEAEARKHECPESGVSIMRYEDAPRLADGASIEAARRYIAILEGTTQEPVNE